MDDIRGAYHGVEKESALLRVLEHGHADTASDAGCTPRDRDLLLDWLRGDTLSLSYDNLDIGDDAPAEIMARSCISCHARQAAAGSDAARAIPLEYWDDVAPLAFSRSISPTDTSVVLASMHAHSISLGMLCVLVVLLSFATRWPRPVLGWLTLIAGLGLALDLGSWFLVRDHAGLVWVIVLGGSAFSIVTALLLCAILLDLWLPRETTAG